MNLIIDNTNYTKHYTYNTYKCIKKIYPSCRKVKKNKPFSNARGCIGSLLIFSNTTNQLSNFCNIYTYYHTTDNINKFLICCTNDIYEIKRSFLINIGHIFLKGGIFTN